MGFEHGDNTNDCSCPIGNCTCDPLPTLSLSQIEEIMKLPLKRKAKMTDKEKIAKLEADVAAYVAELKAIKKLVAPKASSFVVWDPKWTEDLKNLVKHATSVSEDYWADKILGNDRGNASLKLLAYTVTNLKKRR